MFRRAAFRVKCSEEQLLGLNVQKGDILTRNARGEMIRGMSENVYEKYIDFFLQKWGGGKGTTVITVKRDIVL